MNEKIVVVGGGIIGTATTYYLAKKGKHVTLLDGKGLAAGTSSACDQAVLLQTKKPGPLLEFALKSAQLYEDFSEQIDIEYSKGGGMIVFESEEQKMMMEKLVKSQQEAGLEVEIISKKETHNRQNGLADHIVGATWSKHDAKVNSYKTTFAFAELAHKLGAHIYPNEQVIELIVENDKVKGIKTIKQSYDADKIILATGVWTPKLLEKYNLDIPIKPRRGHVLVTEKLPPIVHSNLLSASYIVAKTSGYSETKSKTPSFGVGFVTGQTESGNLLIGGSREFVGFDTTTSIEVLKEIATAAKKVLPYLNQIKIIRAFTGLRPYTIDNLPIISQIDPIEGLYVNAGHEGDGIALAPISGKVMAELVSEEKTSFDITPFSFTSASIRKI